MMMTSVRTLGVALLLAALAAGCQPPANPPVNDQPSAVDQEACAHLANGPMVAVSAATAPGSRAPLLTQAHARYDVTLSFIEGQHMGYVRYQSGKAGDHVIFLNKDVPISVQSVEGPQVALEASTASSTACGEIKGRHVVPLGIGAYDIKIGPTSEQLVGMLIEPAGDQH